MPTRTRDDRPATRVPRTRPSGGAPFDVASAVAHLRAADAKLGAFIERHGACTLQLKDTSSTFAALAEAIVYQQLNGTAAATIFGRFKALYPDRRFPVPEEVVASPDETLRAVGLSRNKMLAIRDLAQRTVRGEVPTIAALRRMPDDDVVQCLTAVRGIGRWTVEMLLIFRLGRQDVLPVDDYGVRKGFAAVYRKSALPSPAELLRHGERWRPYRSVASWYLWRAAESAPRATSRTAAATPGNAAVADVTPRATAPSQRRSAARKLTSSAPR
ncbi:DNA-3-methyladenine glycosylase 2 family protein [Candidatus Binatia bacterium]|nr:DNA-3-methyladenine glycosylase 2 family protein [Candidatus Binatia bacterium]